MGEFRITESSRVGESFSAKVPSWALGAIEAHVAALAGSGSDPAKSKAFVRGIEKLLPQVAPEEAKALRQRLEGDTELGRVFRTQVPRIVKAEVLNILATRSRTKATHGEPPADNAPQPPSTATAWMTNVYSAFRKHEIAVVRGLHRAHELERRVMDQYNRDPENLLGILGNAAASDDRQMQSDYRFSMNLVRRSLEHKRPGDLTPTDRQFLEAAEKMKGPSASKMKSEILLMISGNIGMADQARDDSDAAEYAPLAARLVKSDPGGVARYLADQKDSATQELVFNLLRHQQDEAIYQFYGGLANDVATEMKAGTMSPAEGIEKLNTMMGEGQSAVNLLVEHDKEEIDRGAMILGLPLIAVPDRGVGNAAVGAIADHEEKSSRAAGSRVLSTIEWTVLTAVESKGVPTTGLLEMKLSDPDLPRPDQLDHPEPAFGRKRADTIGGADPPNRVRVAQAGEETLQQAARAERQAVHAAREAPEVSRWFSNPGSRVAQAGDPALAAARAALPDLTKNKGAVGNAYHAARGAAPHGADIATSHTVTELVSTTAGSSRPSTSLLRKKTLQAKDYAELLPAHLAGETVAVNTEVLVVRSGKYYSGGIEWLARTLAKLGISSR